MRCRRAPPRATGVGKVFVRFEDESCADEVRKSAGAVGIASYAVAASTVKRRELEKAF